MLVGECTGTGLGSVIEELVAVYKYCTSAIVVYMLHPPTVSNNLTENSKHISLHEMTSFAT